MSLPPLDALRVSLAGLEHEPASRNARAGTVKLGGAMVGDALRVAVAQGESRATVTVWLTPGGLDAAPPGTSAPTRERLRGARLTAHVEVLLRAGSERDDAAWCSAITDALATHLEGVVLDPTAQRVWDTEEWRARRGGQSFRVEHHVFVEIVEPDVTGRALVRTRGLAEFARAELAMPNVAQAHVGTAAWLLHALAEHTVGGPPLEPRHRASFADAKVGLIATGELLEAAGDRFAADHAARDASLAAALFVVDCEAADAGAPDANDALLAHLKTHVN